VVAISSYNETLKGVSLGAEFHRNRIQLISSMTINECAHRSNPCWSLERLNTVARGMLASGQLIVENLVTHTFSFSEAQEAYDLLNRAPDDVLKIALTYQ
jgi:threonine dehydrogenase-like Zn-dependent dehydrogenase